MIFSAVGLSVWRVYHTTIHTQNTGYLEIRLAHYTKEE
jgi:hypothetical protein